MPTSKKQMLLQCARRLFETEGFHTTGIDRILDEAGVAKMTLYNNFGSKDQLIVAVLDDASRDMIGRLTQSVAPLEDPYDRILGVFDALAAWYSQPEFCGCIFQAADAEFPDPASPPSQAARAHLLRLGSMFESLCRQAELPDAPTLASMLSLLASGANCAARQIRTRAPADHARQIAEILLERACSRGFSTARPIARPDQLSTFLMG